MGGKSSKNSYNVEKVGQSVKSRESLKSKEVEEAQFPVVSNDAVIEEIISAVQKLEDAPRLSREEQKKEEDLIIAKVRGEIIANGENGSQCDVTPKVDEKLNKANDLDTITVIKDEVSESVSIITVQSILEAEKARSVEIVEQNDENHASTNETSKEKQETDCVGEEMQKFKSKKIEHISSISCTNEINTQNKVEKDQTESKEKTVSLPKIEEDIDKKPSTFDEIEIKQGENDAEEVKIEEFKEQIESICNEKPQLIQEEITVCTSTEIVVDTNKNKQEEDEVPKNKSTQLEAISNKQPQLIQEEIVVSKTTEIVDNANKDKQEEVVKNEPNKNANNLLEPIDITNNKCQTEENFKIEETPQVNKEIISTLEPNETNNDTRPLKEEQTEEACIKIESKEESIQLSEALIKTVLTEGAPIEEKQESLLQEKEESAPDKVEIIKVTPKEMFLQQILDVEKIINGKKEKILHFSGSAEDKEFNVLHEELIKYIIKLDDIVFEDEEVKNERRRVIKMIQQCVQNLEKKIEQSNDDRHPSDSE